MAQIPLSESEFNMLTHEFAEPDRQNYMRWRDFCDKVDEVFNIKQLEKDPYRETFTPLQINLTSRQMMTPDEIKCAEKVIEKFKYFCFATRLYVKQFFQDWDALGRNKVTPKQFRQVLVTVRFNLSDEEFKCCTKFFLTEDNYINYADFIEMTQPQKSTNGEAQTSGSNFSI